MSEELKGKAEAWVCRQCLEGRDPKRPKYEKEYEFLLMSTKVKLTLQDGLCECCDEVKLVYGVRAPEKAKEKQEDAGSVDTPEVRKGRSKTGTAKAA